MRHRRHGVGVKRRTAVKVGLGLTALSVLGADAHATDAFNVREEFAAAVREAGATCANPTYTFDPGDRSYVTGDCVAHFGSDVRGAQVWSRLVIRHEVAHLATLGNAHNDTFRAAEARLLAPVGIFAAYTCAYTPELEGTGNEYPKYASTTPLYEAAQTKELSK